MALLLLPFRAQMPTLLTVTWLLVTPDELLLSAIPLVKLVIVLLSTEFPAPVMLSSETAVPLPVPVSVLPLMVRSLLDTSIASPVTLLMVLPLIVALLLVVTLTPVKTLVILVPLMVIPFAPVAE